jgi:hypothetical protein
VSYRKKASKEYSIKAKRLLPKPWLGYRKKKCKVCKTPFILDPLDPDMNICPLHGYVALKERK